MGRLILCKGTVGTELQRVLRETGMKRLFLVCGSSYERLPLYAAIEALPVVIVRFSDFTPNPVYEAVCRGVELFRREGCDGILAVGGGSALDVAKCVKLYCKMNPGHNYLEQKMEDTGVPLIALPTTAGTGSEATRFAVLYFHGEKQSVAHASILPDYALLEPAVLDGLPDYQRRSTLLDAFCQGIESWWSLNSTPESREYSRLAVEGVKDNWRQYVVEREPKAAEAALLAANYAGQAINIAQTTAPHAMSYKLTSLYGLAHGHAVALCLPEVWDYMLEHLADCRDPRGSSYLWQVLSDIARAIGAESPSRAVTSFRELLRALDLSYPLAADRERDLALLARSVDPLRLHNNPVALDSKALLALYERIVRL